MTLKQEIQTVLPVISSLETRLRFHLKWKTSHDQPFLILLLLSGSFGCKEMPTWHARCSHRSWSAGFQAYWTLGVPTIRSWGAWPSLSSPPPEREGRRFHFLQDPQRNTACLSEPIPLGTDTGPAPAICCEYQVQRKLTWASPYPTPSAISSSPESPPLRSPPSSRVEGVEAGH